MVLTRRSATTAIALLTVFGAPVPAFADDDILIGYHGPLTGPASWVGLGGRDGALLAAAEINANGGIRGRKLRLIAYDDANKPSEAEAVAKKMIDGDKVFAILGGAGSNTAVILAEEAKRNKVPYINGSAASPKIMDTGSRWVFSGATIDVRDIAENEAAFVGEYLKVKKVAYLHTADEFSKPLADSVIKILKDKYGVETLVRETYNRGDLDFGSQLIAIRRANPEFLLLSGAYVETARIIRQARELGMHLGIKGDTASMNSGLLVIAGPAAEGTYVEYVAPYFNGDPNENMVKFESRYRQAYPGYPSDRPNYVDALNYGNIYAIAEAIKRAGTPPNPKSFVEALETLSNFKPSDFLPSAVDVIMPLTFTSSHNGNRRMTHFRVQHGVFMRVEDFSAPVPSTAFPSNNSLEW